MRPNPEHPMSDQTLEHFLQSELRAADSAPLYLQLRAAVHKALNCGLLRPGAKLPAERGLAEVLGVSRVTFRKAIDQLCTDGILVRQQGAKTVVAARLEKAVSKLTGFSDEMRSRGREPGAAWLSRSLSKPSPLEAMVLGVSVDSTVLRLERVRLADGEAVALERACVPQSVLPQLELVQHSLYAALEAVGKRPTRGTQRMRAVAATTKDAAILHCAVGAPLLCVERTCFAQHNECIEFTETRYLGSAYDFVTDLQD